MTLYGIDISNNNGSDVDLNAVAASGFSFVFAKVSEGNYFIDATWPGYRAAAQAAGLLVVGYHYAIAADSPASQVATFQSNDGGSAVMIDFEANSGTITDYWALVAAFNAAGITVVLSYVPNWYWQQIGSPSLSQVPGLIASSYVTGSGYASALYPGDTAAQWAPYGGETPQILQFTDQAMVAGSSLDANAFCGTIDQLAALLGTGGTPMALSDAQQADLYQRVCDIWDQLRGPNGAGWPQLGQNASGQNLTPIDALAEVITDLTALSARVAALKTQG